MTRKEYERKYRQDNAERLSEKGKRWREANREYYSNYRKEYYRQNKERILARAKERRNIKILKELE